MRGETITSRKNSGKNAHFASGPKQDGRSPEDRNAKFSYGNNGPISLRRSSVARSSIKLPWFQYEAIRSRFATWSSNHIQNLKTNLLTTVAV